MLRLVSVSQSVREVQKQVLFSIFTSFLFWECGKLDFNSAGNIPYRTYLQVRYVRMSGKFTDGGSILPAAYFFYFRPQCGHVAPLRLGKCWGRGWAGGGGLGGSILSPPFIPIDCKRYKSPPSIYYSFILIFIENILFLSSAASSSSSFPFTPRLLCLFLVVCLLYATVLEPSYAFKICAALRVNNWSFVLLSCLLNFLLSL